MELNKAYRAGKVLDKLIEEGKINSSFKPNTLSELYVVKDITDVWIYRVHENINTDYENEDGCLLLEMEKIDKDDIREKLIEDFNYDKSLRKLHSKSCLNSVSVLDIAKAVLLLDFENGCENWDCSDDYTTMEKIEEEVGQGLDILDISID